MDIRKSPSFLLKRLLNSLRSYRRQWIRQKMLLSYQRGGRKPWSLGYDIHKWNLIEKAINNEFLIEKFRYGLPLPPKYGEFLDERIVEYPWLFSRLTSVRGNLLDVGSILNHRLLLSHNLFGDKKVFFVNLAPESECLCRQGASYVFYDARSLPFKENFFDVVLSVSTLEHVGLDNTPFTGDPTFKEDSRRGYIDAVREMARVLKPGSPCFITLPFGRYRYDNCQQQFNSEMVEGLKESFGLRFAKESYYKYQNGGWDISSRAACEDCEYAHCSWLNFQQSKYVDKNSALDYDADFAAAARAIVALEMVK